MSPDATQTAATPTTEARIADLPCRPSQPHGECRYANGDHGEWKCRRQWGADSVAAIEAAARAEGRREADALLREIAGAAVVIEIPGRYVEVQIDTRTWQLLQGVAGLNASESPPTERRCFCGEAAEWPDGKCDKHHARRGLRDASESPPTLPPCPICAKPDLFIDTDGRLGCPHCEVAVRLGDASESPPEPQR